MINIFYSKYSNYEFSQLCYNDMYQKAIECFLKQVQDNEGIREKLKGILYEGGYDDFTVNSNMTAPDAPMHEIDRRLNFSGLLISDYNTFEKLAQNNVILFHGTNSIALPDILRNGVQSESEIIRRGGKVLTGEFSPTQPRNFVSFTDKLSLALKYATKKPSIKSKNDTSFGVFIGISTNDLKGEDISTIRIPSCTPEIGLIEQLPAKYIRVIAVPNSKIQEVKKMVNENGLDQIEVVKAEGIVNAIALTESYYAIAPDIPNPDCLIIKGSSDIGKTFTTEEVRELAQTRKLGSIKNLDLKLKGKEMDNDVIRDE